MSLGFGTFLYEQLFLDFKAPDADLTGKTALVTGSNVGLGFETAVQLLERGVSRLIMGVRNMEKGAAAKERMLQRVPGAKSDQVEVWQLDLASYDNTRAFADKCANELDRLDIAILNAAVANLKYRKTADGHEESTQVNSISTGLLALLLLPVLQRNKTPAFKPHLVVVASSVHYWAKLVTQKEPSILAGLDDPKLYTDDRYQDTKLLDVYLVREIAKLPAAQGILVSAPCPGLCVSELRRDMSWLMGKMLDSLAWTTEKGARNFVYAALADDFESGSFLFGARPRDPSTANVTSEHGQALQKRAWGELTDEWRRLDSRTDAILKA